MADSTTIRIDRTTHESLKQLAREQRTTVSDTVARAVRLLRQEQIGRDLASDLDADETAWLDADFG